jgi:hypothetical protein
MGSGAQTYAFGYAYDGLENLVARTASGPRDLGILTGTYRYGENGRGPRQLTSVQAPTLMRASTVAGGGQVSGDGGAAVLARLSSPGGPSAFANESFVFPEPGSHRVRKVAANGTLSTFAGTGAAAYARRRPGKRGASQPADERVGGSRRPDSLHCRHAQPPCSQGGAERGHHHCCWERDGWLRRGRWACRERQLERAARRRRSAWRDPVHRRYGQPPHASRRWGGPSARWPDRAIRTEALEMAWR